ncbi:MAG TPA: hypothetical protein VHP37_29610 [Burkholderiales bacterium]|nr:hypothetical protein [Burkholderiales bacterium]
MDEPRYWFRAKRYGWGWGRPVTWEGWVVLGVFAALLAAGLWLFPPEQARRAFVVYSLALAAAVVAVCWIKGEPPRWRWGDSNNDRKDGV